TRAIGKTRRGFGNRVHVALQRRYELQCFIGTSDDTADRQNHLKDLDDAPLVECKNCDAASNQLSSDVGLEIREREYEIWFECEDLVELRIDVSGDLWLLTRFGRT